MSITLLTLAGVVAHLSLTLFKELRRSRCMMGWGCCSCATITKGGSKNQIEFETPQTEYKVPPWRNDPNHHLHNNNKKEEEDTTKDQQLVISSSPLANGTGTGNPSQTPEFSITIHQHRKAPTP